MINYLPLLTDLTNVIISIIFFVGKFREADNNMMKQTQIALNKMCLSSYASFLQFSQFWLCLSPILIAIPLFFRVFQGQSKKSSVVFRLIVIIKVLTGILTKTPTEFTEVKTHMFSTLQIQQINADFFLRNIFRAVERWSTGATFCSERFVVQLQKASSVAIKSLIKFPLGRLDCN